MHVCQICTYKSTSTDIMSARTCFVSHLISFIVSEERVLVRSKAYLCKFIYVFIYYLCNIVGLLIFIYDIGVSVNYIYNALQIAALCCVAVVFGSIVMHYEYSLTMLVHCIK